MIQNRIVSTENIIIMNEITNFIIQISKKHHYDENLSCPNEFYSKNIPSITIREYLHRFIQYCNLEGSTILISLIYMDRFCEINQVKLTKFNIYRILMISLTLALKYNEDTIYKNDFYAKVGGVGLQDFNKKEKVYLDSIHFSICRL